MAASNERPNAFYEVNRDEKGSPRLVLSYVNELVVERIGIELVYG